MTERVLPPTEGCRLLRSDGSAWTVTGLRRREGRILVDARRELETAEDDVVPFRRPVRLEAKRLAFGDRLVWEREDGSRLWATRNPVDGKLAWGIDPDADRGEPQPDDSEDGGFFEDGFLGAI